MNVKFDIGDLVRTKKISSKGVFKDTIKFIEYINGIEYLRGKTWSFPSNEMEIIRKKV